jgi:hypothetical protein
MSTKTRREKRKATAAQPVETDWLWSCPPGMPLGEIGTRLGFTSEPRTELSAHSWADERQMVTDLYQARMPNRFRGGLVGHVVWDAVDDDLRGACAHGCLIVLRDLPAEVPHAVQMLIDIIGFRRRERDFPAFESRPGARFALVLEGWSATTIRVRASNVTHYLVQALGGHPGAESASEP